MTDEARPIDPSAGIDGPLAVDTPCIHCGYNLRGLTPVGRCPECGAAIVDSTRGNLLRFADPLWLDTLRKGAALKLWNIVIGILLGIGGGVVAALFGSQVVMHAVQLVGSALGLWATFLITSQEPSVSLDEDPMTLRRVIRGCAAAGFVGTLIPDVSMFGRFGGTGLMVLLVVLGSLLALAGVVVYFGELVYLRRFARRIPDEKLTKSTTIVLWLLPAGLGLMVVTGVIAGIATGAFSMPAPAAGTQPAGPSGLATGVMGFTGCFGLLLMVVGSVWYIDLLMKYRKAFAEAAYLLRSGDRAG